MSSNDSNSPILTVDDGWYMQRDSNDVDIYVFAYQRDYLEAIRDFYNLTGPVPKITKICLGELVGRYYPYDDKKYVELLKKFEHENIPFP